MRAHWFDIGLVFIVILLELKGWLPGSGDRLTSKLYKRSASYQQGLQKSKMATPQVLVKKLISENAICVTIDSD